MSSWVVGEPLWAVLVPPQLARFRALADLGDTPITVDLTGWNKYVLLAGDRAFLFPRQASNVEWFHRALEAYRALEPIAGDRTVARPRPPDLPGARPPAHHDTAPMRWLRRGLDAETTHDAAAEAAERLGRRRQLAQWAELLESAARHRHVHVHGDIHEDQLLVVDDQLTGILDWETARIDHPFWDFDLGEWGTGLWRQHRHDFSRLWAMLWRAYANERGLDPDPVPLEAAFRLRHALHLVDNDGDPSVMGTIDEHLGAI